jgi:hypothetical protein
MRGNALLTILIGLALALAGCSHDPVVPTRHWLEEKGRGVVVLSVSHDLVDPSETGAYFFMDEKEIGLRGMLGTPLRGHASDFKTRHGQVQILSLEPGMHTIERWQLKTTINMRKPKILPAPLAFLVKEGEIVYIGNLHLRLQLESGFLNAVVIKAAVPVIQDHSVEDIEVAEQRAPNLRNRITVRLLPLGPWVPRQP